MVARLWIPAFAGMTGAIRERRGKEESGNGAAGLAL